MTSFVEAARREKLAELIKRGVVAFAYRFDRTTTARAALEGFREGDATVHRVAGRLILLRRRGALEPVRIRFDPPLHELGELLAH